MERPVILITAEMLTAARQLEEQVRVHRTRVSTVDSLGGILGEFAFAQWLFGDWRRHEVGDNKGRADLLDAIEVKTSIYPFRETLNLVIREDYGAKFKPVYVQLIIDVRDPKEKLIVPGLPVILCGFASHAEATAGPAEQMPMGGGRMTPFKAFTTPISRLHPMADFREHLVRLGVSLPS